MLPTVQNLLAKFREYLPTIKKVIGIVGQVIGAVLKFAAAVLGKVLPPVIQFAGFLIRTLVPAIANVIGIGVKFIAKVIDIGRGVHRGRQEGGRVRQDGRHEGRRGHRLRAGPAGQDRGLLPQRRVAALTAGGNIIDGLISGIRARPASSVSTIQSYVIDKIPGSVRGRSGIASPSKVMHLIGQQTIQGLVQRHPQQGGDVDDAAREIAQKLVNQIER